MCSLDRALLVPSQRKENHMAQPTLSPAAQEQLRAIADTVLGMETLETRCSDSLDFHDLSVWSIKAALEAAYLAGMVDHHRSAA